MSTSYSNELKKAEKLAYEGSEDSKSDNEDIKEEEEEDKTSNKCNNSDISAEEPKDNEGNDGDGAAANVYVRAYNEVKNLIGDFDFTNISESDIYAKALNNKNIEIRGNETLGELKAMFRVYNSLNRDIMAKAAIVSNSGFSFKVPSLYDI